MGKLSEWAIKSTPLANIIYCCLITSSGQKNVFLFFSFCEISLKSKYKHTMRVNYEIYCCILAAATQAAAAG